MRALAAALVMLAAPALAHAEDFTYDPPGVLVPGSGTGRMDDTVYAPGIRFPIEEGPAYPNSQVWGVGGSQGPSGSQCDPRNYSYPWHDDYCESRSWDMPLCPSGTGHQGQDIRPSTCDDNTHWTVATEDGTITSIGTYSVYLVGDSGTRHRYLHQNVASIRVREGQRVTRGERIGRVSNEFGGTSTTIHLHYDIHQNVSGVGGVYVSPYMSLVRSYEELLGMPAEPCFVVPADGGTLDDTGPCFRQFGPPDYWRVQDGMGEGGSIHWTNAWDGDSPGNWARWEVHLAAAGTYRVEVSVADGYNLSKEVPYLVRHAGEETRLSIDQTTASGWLDLGVFDFAEGGEQAIEIYDNSGETLSDLHITADAVRITPYVAEVDAGVVEETPDAAVMVEADAGPGGARIEAEAEAGCSCRAAGRGDGRGGALLAIGVLALAFWRRRGR